MKTTPTDLITQIDEYQEHRVASQTHIRRTKTLDKSLKQDLPLLKEAFERHNFVGSNDVLLQMAKEYKETGKLGDEGLFVINLLALLSKNKDRIPAFKQWVQDNLINI